MKRRMRRLLALLLCVLLVGAGSGTALAEEWLMEIEAGENADELVAAANAEPWEIATNVPADTASLEVGGKGAVLMDLDSGTVLYEHDSHERMPIASVTKVMTMLLIMEAIDEGRLEYTDMLTCSPTAASMGGSQIWLEPNETMSVDDLLKAIAVVSANDACAMMAEHLSGSIGTFVAEMNERAAQLGMEDTLFLDCCGLDDNAYSSAYDVALMSRELMKHEDVTKYTTIWMDTLRGGESQLVNTNKLVRFYQGATGLKTGTTSTAGHNLSATAERDGLRLCAVILGCSTTDERFGGCRTMLDYGFANYAVYTPQLPEGALHPVPVLHGTEQEVVPTVPGLSTILVRRGQEGKVNCAVELSADVEAPVYEGETIGKVVVTLDGEEIGSYPVLAEAGVPRLTFWGAFARLFAALAI